MRWSSALTPGALSTPITSWKREGGGSRPVTGTGPGGGAWIQDPLGGRVREGRGSRQGSRRGCPDVTGMMRETVRARIIIAPPPNAFCPWWSGWEFSGPMYNRLPSPPCVPGARMGNQVPMTHKLLHPPPRQSRLPVARGGGLVGIPASPHHHHARL